MNAEYLIITAHLLGAVVAGGIIGLERSYHGRPAGFRTHALVCLSSSLLMLVTLYQAQWMPAMQAELFRTDPTRMAQGIMTGIGFLGAGVIYKEDFSVRGLTTAASIWLTAAIGILFGIGFYFPAILCTVLALGILSLFRHIEANMPSHVYAHYNVSFDRDDTMPEEALRTLLKTHGFNVANMSYHTKSKGLLFEYRMVLRTNDLKNHALLADALRKLPQVREFGLSPTDG
jgi:putative Mg2+ transporter-C (MgtC) family protein